MYSQKQSIPDNAHDDLDATDLSDPEIGVEFMFLRFDIRWTVDHPKTQAWKLWREQSDDDGDITWAILCDYYQNDIQVNQTTDGDTAHVKHKSEQQEQQQEQQQVQKQQQHQVIQQQLDYQHDNQQQDQGQQQQQFDASPQHDAHIPNNHPKVSSVHTSILHLRILKDPVEAINQVDFTKISPQDREVLQRFSQHIHAIPQWLNIELVQRGQVFFWKHFHPIMFMLYHASLVPGHVFNQINQVLHRTSNLSSKNSIKANLRLLKTLKMIIEAMMSTKDLLPQGQGWLEVIRVRFLHAMVRQRIWALHQHASDQLQPWNQSKWGVPINQADALATLLSFSTNIILFMESFFHTDISEDDKCAYIHVWRYIGYLSGIAESLNPCLSYQQSKAILESYVFFHFTPNNPLCIRDCHQLICSLSHKSEFLFKLVAETIRQVNGDQLADALHLPQSSLHSLIVNFGLYPFLRVVLFFTQIDFPWSQSAERNKKFALRACRRVFKIQHSLPPKEIDMAV